jgi:hypothetical protein
MPSPFDHSGENKPQNEQGFYQSWNWTQSRLFSSKLLDLPVNNIPGIFEVTLSDQTRKAKSCVSRIPKICDKFSKV